MCRPQRNNAPDKSQTLCPLLYGSYPQRQKRKPLVYIQKIPLENRLLTPEKQGRNNVNAPQWPVFTHNRYSSQYSTDNSTDSFLDSSPDSSTGYHLTATSLLLAISPAPTPLSAPFVLWRCCSFLQAPSFPMGSIPAETSLPPLIHFVRLSYGAASLLLHERWPHITAPPTLVRPSQPEKNRPRANLLKRSFELWAPTFAP